MNKNRYYNKLAISSFIGWIIVILLISKQPGFMLLGIPCVLGGIFSYRQIRLTKEKGKWFSIISMALGSIFLFMWAEKLISGLLLIQTINRY